MFKLLVNAPTGAQEVILVGEGGGYFDPERVIWDERTDGALPEGVVVGGMVRVDGALAFDQQVFDQRDNQSREKAQAQAWESIKAERDHRQKAGVLVQGKWFHSDDSSRIQQLGLVMMGTNMPANLEWKTMDGSFVIMTPSLASQIFTGTALRDQAIFARAEQHRAAMQASANPEAYDFSAGWPLGFGEVAG
jgi:hypothetical protein